MGSHFVKTGLGNDVASAQYFDTPQQAFSQANQNLQAAGGGVPNFLAQRTDATVTPGDPSNPESAPSIQGGNLAPSFLSQPTNLPKIQTPSFLQAQNDPQLAQKSETKMGKLFQILNTVASGGAAGLGQRTVGAGFAAAQDSSIQRQQARQAQQEADLKQQQGKQQLQLGNAEIQMLPLKYQAAGLGLQKTEAETAKAQAEALATPIEAELKKAQASAAKYKEVNGQLFDVSGDKPVAAQGVGQMVPADDKIAKLANIPVGTPLPIDTYTKLNTAANSGVQSVQANGRSLLVDKQGNTIKDLGASTPVVTMNMQMGGGSGGAATTPGGATSFYAKLAPARQKVVDQIGTNKEDMATALAPYRRFPGVAEQMQAALGEKYPDWNQANFQIGKKVTESATSGKIGDELNAFNTALAHADLLEKALDALHNGDTPALNSLKNSWKQAFGEGGPITAQAVANAYGREVTKAVSAGHITDSEIGTQNQTLPINGSPGMQQGVIGAYKNLMASKLAIRRKQVELGQQGKVNYGAAGDNAPQSSSPKLGDVVKVGGKSVKITSLHADGTFDAEPVK